VSDNTFPFQNLAKHLDLICQKESKLTETMRSLADQADDLMGEMATLKHLLQKADSPSAESLRSYQTTQSIEVIEPPLSLDSDFAPPPIQAGKNAPLNEPISRLQETSNPHPSAEADLSKHLNRAHSALPQSSAEADTQHASKIESWPSDWVKPSQFSEATQTSYFSGPKPEKHSAFAFEMDLGIKWLSRIGIVALLIGLAMAISYSFPSFPNPMKIGTGLLLAGAMYGIGQFLYAQTPVLGRILQGGGLSVGYLSLFATFFIPEVRLLDIPSLGLSVLFLYVASTLFLAHRLNSQTVTMLSLAFGYYTSHSAESANIALVLSSFLSLGTVGITKFHPEWRAISKVNLAGALVLYLLWNSQAQLGGTLEGKAYLAFTFILFHIVSLLRGRTGDQLLNILNCFGFYSIYSATQPLLGSAGILELLISGIQLGTLLITKMEQPEEHSTELRYTLLITGLLFIGIGTVRYFDGTMVSAILSSEALALGFLSKKSTYRETFIAFSCIALGFAYLTLFGSWGQLSQESLLITASWIALTILILESIPFRNFNKGVRAAFLVLAQFLMMVTIFSQASSNWRTVSLTLSGFVLLGSGLFFARKSYRVSGLIWIFVLAGFSLLGDLAFLSMGYKILTFILLGLGLLGGSFGYSILAKKLPPKTEDREEEAIISTPKELHEID